MAFGVLDHRGRADSEVGTEFVDRGNVLLKAGTILDVRAARLKPFAIRIRPLSPWTGCADIRHLGARFDQQSRHQQFGTFIARYGDAALDRLGCKRCRDRGQELVLRCRDLVSADPAGITDGREPSGGAIATDRRAAHDLAASRFEFAD